MFAWDGRGAGPGSFRAFVVVVLGLTLHTEVCSGVRDQVTASGPAAVGSTRSMRMRVKKKLFDCGSQDGAPCSASVPRSKSMNVASKKLMRKLSQARSPGAASPSVVPSAAETPTTSSSPTRKGAPGSLKRSRSSKSRRLIQYVKKPRRSHLIVDYSRVDTDPRAQAWVSTTRVPSAEEVDAWIGKLRALAQLQPVVHESPKGDDKYESLLEIRENAANDDAESTFDQGQSDSSDSDIYSTKEVDVSEEIEIALRFAMLAYWRNNWKQGCSAALFTNRADRTSEIIEIECHDDAHGVLYLYRLPEGGIGVVVALKGTNRGSVADIKTNFKATTSVKGIKTPFGTVKVGMHKGMRAYYEKLLAQMMKTNMASLRPILEEWSGEQVRHKTLYDWLYDRNTWKWIAFTGHSLGAGMAQIGAVHLGGALGILADQDRRVFLAFAGSPTIGNEEFRELAMKIALPFGGLRIECPYDWITVLGIMKGKKIGVPVTTMAPNEMTLDSDHTTYLVPSRYTGSYVLTAFSVRNPVDKYELWALDKTRYHISRCNEPCMRSGWLFAEATAAMRQVPAFSV